MKVKKFLSFLSVLVCFVVIFMFSNQVANASSEISNGVESYVNNFVIIQKLLNYFPIRKVAHFSLYFILAILLLNMLNIWFNFKRQYLYYILSLCISFIYACSDEFHQLFVEGRGASFKDVLIDSSGALVSLILFYIFQLVIMVLRGRYRDAQVEYNN